MHLLDFSRGYCFFTLANRIYARLEGRLVKNRIHAIFNHGFPMENPPVLITNRLTRPPWRYLSPKRYVRQQMHVCKKTSAPENLLEK